MGQWSAWFVPRDQERFVGRERDVAEAFWRKGIFLATSDGFVYERVRDWKAREKPLPDPTLQLSFAEMGITDEPRAFIVPNLVYDLCCPACDSELSDSAYELWEADDAPAIEDIMLECPTCSHRFLSTEIGAKETRFTFARFYLWVSDIDPEIWDASFKVLVEAVLGQCDEYLSWET